MHGSLPAMAALESGTRTKEVPSLTFPKVIKKSDCYYYYLNCRLQASVKGCSRKTNLNCYLFEMEMIFYYRLIFHI